MIFYISFIYTNTLYLHILHLQSVNNHRTSHMAPDWTTNMNLFLVSYVVTILLIFLCLHCYQCWKPQFQRLLTETLVFYCFKDSNCDYDLLIAIDFTLNCEINLSDICESNIFDCDDNHFSSYNHFDFCFFYLRLHYDFFNSNLNMAKNQSSNTNL